MVQALRVFVLATLLAAGAAHAQQAPTCTVTATPEVLTGGGTVTIVHTSTNATLCVASGGWSGPKDCAGATQTVQVTESRTFALTVKAAQGKVTARWTKPTTNQDGSPATITGYKFYIADAASGLPSATALDLPASPLEYVFWRSPGNVSAGIKAVRSDGVDSAMSNIPSKTVTAAQAQCSDSVTVNPRPKAPTLTLTWLKELFAPKRDNST